MSEKNDFSIAALEEADKQLDIFEEEYNFKAICYESNYKSLAAAEIYLGEYPRSLPLFRDSVFVRALKHKCQNAILVNNNAQSILAIKMLMKQSQ